MSRGTIAIPKSTDKAHIESNLKAAAISLSEDEIQNISASDKNYRFVDGSFWAMEGSPYSMEFLWGK